MMEDGDEAYLVLGSPKGMRLLKNKMANADMHYAIR
jgi:hypothetical protein